MIWTQEVKGEDEEPPQLLCRLKGSVEERAKKPGWLTCGSGDEAEAEAEDEDEDAGEAGSAFT